MIFLFKQRPYTCLLILILLQTWSTVLSQDANDDAANTGDPSAAGPDAPTSDGGRGSPADTGSDSSPSSVDASGADPLGAGVVPEKSSPYADASELLEDTILKLDNTVGSEVDIAGVSNIHFHLMVPRYYTPYEEVPFVYFVDATHSAYDESLEKHYFSLHMGSTPFNPSYGLLLSRLPAGDYTVHVGRAYNTSWVADAVTAADNSTLAVKFTVSDTHTTTSLNINVESWSDLWGETFVQSADPSADRIFLLRAHYKSIECDTVRRIWMYLPPDYEIAQEKRYPVLFAHWGQLMFDLNGNANEWKLDRALNDAFNNVSACAQLTHGVIVVAIEALPTKVFQYREYIVSSANDHDTDEEENCRSYNNIRTFAGSFKRHIHSAFRTIPQWNYTTMIGYGTAGGLTFDTMTKYYRVFGKFLVLSWILDETYENVLYESEILISEAVGASSMWHGRMGKNSTKTKNLALLNRLFPMLYMTWTVGEEPAEITRAKDNAKGMRHRGMPVSHINIDAVNTAPTPQFYTNQVLKAICWSYANSSSSDFNDVAPWWEEEGNATGPAQAAARRKRDEPVQSKYTNGRQKKQQNIIEGGTFI